MALNQPQMPSTGLDSRACGSVFTTLHNPERSPCWRPVELLCFLPFLNLNPTGNSHRIYVVPTFTSTNLRPLDQNYVMPGEVNFLNIISKFPVPHQREIMLFIGKPKGSATLFLFSCIRFLCVCIGISSRTVSPRHTVSPTLPMLVTSYTQCTRGLIIRIRVKLYLRLNCTCHCCLNANTIWVTKIGA